MIKNKLGKELTQSLINILSNLLLMFELKLVFPTVKNRNSYSIIYLLFVLCE